MGRKIPEFTSAFCDDCNWGRATVRGSHGRAGVLTAARVHNKRENHKVSICLNDLYLRKKNYDQ